MSDQQGIWTMKRAHLQELRAAAERHRRLKTIRGLCSAMLEVLGKVVRMIGVGVVRGRRQMPVEQGSAY